MGRTIFNEFTYPNENQDPHYQSLVSFFNQQDHISYTNKLKNYFILMGGGSLTWNGSTGLFSWTEDFAVKNVINGFLVKIQYGPDTINREASLQNGQILYFQFPTALTQEQNKNFLVSDTIGKTDNYFIAGMRYQTNLYLSNGIIL